MARGQPLHEMLDEARRASDIVGNERHVVRRDHPRTRRALVARLERAHPPPTGQAAEEAPVAQARVTCLGLLAVAAPVAAGCASAGSKDVRARIGQRKPLLTSDERHGDGGDAVLDFILGQHGLQEAWVLDLGDALVHPLDEFLALARVLSRQFVLEGYVGHISSRLAHGRSMADGTFAVPIQVDFINGLPGGVGEAQGRRTRAARDRRRPRHPQPRGGDSTRRHPTRGDSWTTKSRHRCPARRS